MHGWRKSVFLPVNLQRPLGAGKSAADKENPTIKRITRFRYILLLTVLLLPGCRDRSRGSLTDKHAFYKVDITGAYRMLEGTGVGARAIRFTLSPKSSSEIPSLSLRLLHDSGAQDADIDPAVAGMIQKIKADTLGKTVNDRKIALPIAGYPARGRMVTRELMNGQAVSYFLFAFVDGKQRLHGVTLTVDGDDPPIPFEFDTALRTLAIEGQRGTATEFNGTMVYCAPYANFYLVYPIAWQLILYHDLKKPDVICADPKGLSRPHSMEPVLFIHKEPASGDARQTATRRYRGGPQKVITREIYVGPWPAVCSAYLDAASKVMVWDYDVFTGQQTLRFTITQAAKAFTKDPPKSMRAVLASIYL
jgi:hypothetical protein